MATTTRLNARGDDGRSYIVLRIEREADTSDLAQRSSIPTLPEYRLADGRPLNLVDQDTLEIAGTAERLHIVR